MTQTHDEQTVKKDSFERLSNDMADMLEKMSQEQDLNVCYSMAIDALDMHTSRIAALPQQEVSVQEAAKVLMNILLAETVEGCQLRCIVGHAEHAEKIQGLRFVAALRAISEGKA